MPETHTVNTANNMASSLTEGQIGSQIPEENTTNQIVDLVQSELLDIEYPIDPGVDWLGLTQSFVWGLLIVLILAGLVYLFWRSKSSNNGVLIGVLKLKWQLKTLAPGLVDSTSVDNLSETMMDKTILMSFYLWIKDFEHCLQHLHALHALKEVDNQQALVHFTELKYRSQAMAFSQYQVSRETYEQVFIQAKSLLKQLLTAKVIIAYIKAKLTKRGQS